MNEDDKTPQKEPWTPEWGLWIMVILFALVIWAVSTSSEPESAPTRDIGGQRGMARIVRLV